MHAIVHALSITGSMTWEITWALILGFTLSAVIQAVVRRSTVVRLLGDARPRTLAVAAGLGAASSSCSYAAVALARALFRKGADFTAAMAFEIASTNLVIELGVILALLMGWQFTLAEFTGGPLMIVFLAVLFRLFLRGRLLRQAREQADRGLAGSMEGHAAMDMSVQRQGSFASRLFSGEGFTSVSHVFVMEWAAIIRDLVIGLLVAGAIAAWVPDSFWQAFFFAGHPLAAKLWGPLIGPVVAVISFVCSVGNVPLAVVLWKGGISFGGVTAFIFADLIIAPILNIYRKYYGTKMAAFLLGTFFAAMAGAGYVVELVFGGLGLIPGRSSARIPDSGVSWDYTTWLNIVFLVLAAVLITRFFRSGGGMMLKMMGGAPEQPGAEGGDAHHGMHATADGHGMSGAHQVPGALEPDGSRLADPTGDQGRGHKRGSGLRMRWPARGSSRDWPGGPPRPCRSAASGAACLAADRLGKVSFEVSADAYMRFMGQYSEPLARRFADLAGIGDGQRVLDVGCGPGALTAELVNRVGAASVSAVEPSASFAAAVRERLPGVEVRRSAAEQLPFPDGTFDVALAQLVVHFMADPVRGLREMRRVTRPGGTVAACVWDYAGGRGPLAAFWSAVRELDPAAADESGRPGVREGHLASLFRQAGLDQASVSTLTVRIRHATFDHWWQPFTLGVGPAGVYVASLTPDRRTALREQCRRLLPAGPVEITAAAWAVTGRT